MSSLQNWWDHLKDLTTPQSRQFKNDFGGKAGLLEFLRQDGELARHILPSFYISPYTLNRWNIPELPKRMKNRELLYRSTNPHDAYDFIGQLPTLSGASDTHTKTLENIRDILSSNHMKSYLAKRGIPHPSQETGILIQNQLSYRFRGSVVEHPHFPGKYIVSMTNAQFWDDIHHSSSMEMQVFGEKWELSEWEWGRKPYYGLWAMEQLIALYQKIQKKGVFEDGISFQMEYGVDTNGKPYIFQVRQFRPFEISRWDVTDLRWHNISFWLTPPEWVDLNLQVCHGRSVSRILCEWVQEGVNGIIVPYLRGNIDPEWLLWLKFFSIGMPSRWNLEHHLFDPAMKVPFVALNASKLPEEVQKWNQLTKGKTYSYKYISDGTDVEFKNPDEEEKSIAAQLLEAERELEEALAQQEALLRSRK